MAKNLYIICTLTGCCAFSALLLLAGRQEEHSACKNEVMRCWLNLVIAEGVGLNKVCYTQKSTSYLSFTPPVTSYIEH